VLERHSLRWSGGLDFVSLVAVKMADQLNNLNSAKVPPFPKMLDRVADAVRHQISRTARQRLKESPAFDDVISHKSDPDPQRMAIVDELLRNLDLEQQFVVTCLADGIEISEVAARLRVSVRTIYRQIQKIKAHLATV
jgi:DNA-binding NarL/FixJ family response regulator